MTGVVTPSECPSMRPPGAGDEAGPGEGRTLTPVGEATLWWPGPPAPCRASPSVVAAEEGPLEEQEAADAVEDEAAADAEVGQAIAGILWIRDGRAAPKSRFRPLRIQ